jgi:hypothetical protein
LVGSGWQSLIGLQSLPKDVPGFISTDNFERALFDCIGEYFSLGYVPRRPTYFHGKSEAQKKQEIDAWQTKLRENWLIQERPLSLTPLAGQNHFLRLATFFQGQNSEKGFGDRSFTQGYSWP